MAENNSKLNNWQRVNFQNIQAAHTTQYQKKKTQPNQKVGKWPKQTLLQRRHESVSSVAQSCPTLCDLMNHSTRGLPVHHELLEFTQTHAHRVSVAIQPSHPLLSPFPPDPNPSQHQSLFQWVNSSHEVATVASFLPKKSQDWSPSEWTGWISLQSKGLSRVFSSTIVQKHQFFGAQLSSQSNSHIHTWPLEKP